MKAEIYNKTQDSMIVRWSDEALGYGELSMKWDFNTSRFILDSENTGVDTVIRIMKAIS